MTLRDWLIEHPPPDEAFTQTVSGVADRVIAGEPFLPTVRELLDDFSLRNSDSQRRRAMENRPRPTGDQRYDAYLAALAEHLAAAAGITRPAWTCERDRFLRPVLVRQRHTRVPGAGHRRVTSRVPAPRHLHLPRLARALLTAGGPERDHRSAHCPRATP
ncbi:MAG TPA: hypothetical protein VM142_01105 [Acidimicrobiales bacterium]|nr:hypothetical protein [Acidimicrobiales bacterium]